MKNITLLMTGIGGPGARGYIHCLKQNGERSFRIIGTDISKNIDPDSRKCIDAFYIIPRADTESYLPRILEICEKEAVDVLLPLNTVELECLSLNRKEFERIGTRVCVIAYEDLLIVNNKTALLTKLQSFEIRTPSFRIVRTVPEFDRALVELGYPEKPVVVKRPDGNGSRGMRFLDTGISRASLFLNSKPSSMYISANELKSILPEVFTKTSLLVMEMVPGQEYSVDALVDHGRVVRSVCRRVDVIEESNDVDATIEQCPDVLRYCDLISEQLKLDGLVGFGIKRNAKGEPLILEINPRLQSTTILSAMGGVNFPYAAVQKALGERVSLPAPQEGVRTIQRKQRVFFDQAGNELMRI